MDNSFLPSNVTASSRISQQALPSPALNGCQTRFIALPERSSEKLAPERVGRSHEGWRQTAGVILCLLAVGLLAWSYAQIITLFLNDIYSGVGISDTADENLPATMPFYRDYPKP
jgi:ferric-dicitrate binding protein FerR (iron transport regulator)